MEEFLFPTLPRQELLELSSLALAHIGDGIYELMARTHVIRHGGLLANQMHRKTIELVCARAQAQAAQLLQPEFTEEEKAVYLRGRNSKPKTMPKSAAPGDYAAATGLEAVFGMLYLTGQKERLCVLFEKIIQQENKN